MLSDATDGEDDSELGGGLIGKSFGDYEILEEINRGGMGVVFKARQVGLNRIVALKLMQGGVLASQKAAARFQREAEAVAKLDHPHVIPIYEIGEAAGHCFFSMKYVEGGTLGDSVGKFVGKPELASKLMIKLSRAVQFAHEQGVLHRDIKPQNVLVDELGEPFITDFGLAKSDSEDAQITVSGEVFGSPSFMAPEQASGQHRAVGRRTDVYGLGAVLYHLLTGTPPFNGKTSFELMKQVVEQRPLNPRQLDSSLPSELVAICLKCLKKDPESRYGSAEALADDLEKWLVGESVSAGPAVTTPPLGAWARRHVGILTTLGAAVIMALVSESLLRRSSEQGETLPVAPELSFRATNGVHPSMPLPNDGATDNPDAGGLSTPTPTQAFALLSPTFEIPAKDEDPSGNPIRKGYDQNTGLPFEIREPRTGMHFMLIPAGIFVKGELESEENKETKRRRIQRPFYLGKYEMTIDEFRIFAEAKEYVTHQQRGSADMHYPFKRQDIDKEFSWSRLLWPHTGRHPLCLVRHTDVEPLLAWLNADAVGSFDVPTV